MSFGSNNPFRPMAIINGDVTGWNRRANKAFSRDSADCRKRMVATAGHVDRYDRFFLRINDIRCCNARGVRIPRSLRRFL